MEFTADPSITCMRVQLSIKQLPLVMTKRLFHVSNTRGPAQLRPGAAFILQFCVNTRI